MKHEKLILLVLACVQFTNILDFMIMMPLGPQMMRIFHIHPHEFGLLVSSYTLSAGVFGFLGAFVIDRFDRKKALLVAYAGFTIGTWACGISQGYDQLMAARILTGMFGGSLGAIVLSTIGDIIPFERRGSAMGIVMAAFAFASVIGVPLGLYLANQFDWHAPFFFLGGMAMLVSGLIFFVIPTITGHMGPGKGQNPKEVITNILKDNNQLRGLLMMVLLILGQFTVIPFISPYMVANVGFTEQQLMFIYLIGGGASVFTSPILGKLADKYGKLTIFTIFASLTCLPILVITNLPQTPIYIVLVVTTIFFVFMGGRMIPAMAIISSTVKPVHRGSFMSITTSVQQLASGVGSYLAGMVMVKDEAGHLHNYPLVGYFAVVASLLCVWVAQKVKPVD